MPEAEEDFDAWCATRLDAKRKQLEANRDATRARYGEAALVGQS